MVSPIRLSSVSLGKAGAEAQTETLVVPPAAEAKMVQMPLAGGWPRGR